MGFGDFFQHLFLVMASGLGLIGIPLPMPLPPLPEDPALLRVAPADSLLFVEWFGNAGPAAEPSNRSERLAAEPEVRAAIAKLVAATRGTLEQDGRDRKEAPAVLALYDMLVEAMQRPGCAFVAELKPFAGGLVVHIGKDAPAVATAFGKALDQLVPEQMKRASKEIGDVKFETLLFPVEIEFFGWAAIDDYFVLAVGRHTAKQIVAGLREQDPGLGGNADLQKLRAGCKVERPVLRTYAAIEQLGEQAQFATRLWQPLGMSACPAALAESGLEGDDFVSRLQLALPRPSGLLGELRGKPLSQDDLALIPEDATMALALRGGEGSFEKLLLGIMASVAGQDIGADYRQFLARASEASGTDIRDDLMVHADDCAVAWSSPGQGGMGFTGAVLSVPLRDGKAFEQNLTAMWDKMTGTAPNKAGQRAQGNRLSPRAGYLEHFLHGDRKIWWVDLIDRDMPFGLSWSSTDQHFLFGLMPQPLRSAIDASRLPNFDRALVRKPMVARRGQAVAMLYLDMQGVLQQAYAPGLMLFQLSSYEWQREGFDFDLADVPRLQSLAPHLGPELTVLEATADGCRLTRRGTVPVLDPLLVSCGMACLLAVN